MLSDKLDEYELHLNVVCHADLKCVDSDTYDQLITSYPVEDQELDLKFFDFMKNVLYRTWAPFIFLEQTEAGLYYIRIGPLSKIPANIVYNFCICSRVIVEHRNFLKIWNELTIQGLHPAFAFAICRSGVTDLDQIVRNVGVDEEHWPFYLAVSLKKLMVDGPKKTGVNFKESPYACTPTNVIWGDATQDVRSLQGKTIRQFWEKWKEILSNENIL